jgi:large subunit ribosomal protein L29
MNYDDIANKTPDELVKTLMDLKKEQMELRFKASGGQIDKTHEIRVLRRNIARVQTAINAPVQEVKAVKKVPAKKKTTTKKSEEKAA